LANILDSESVNWGRKKRAMSKSWAGSHQGKIKGKRTGAQRLKGLTEAWNAKGESHDTPSMMPIPRGRKRKWTKVSRSSLKE